MTEGVVLVVGISEAKDDSVREVQASDIKAYSRPCGIGELYYVCRYGALLQKFPISLWGY